jgi:hypothetical protein
MKIEKEVTSSQIIVTVSGDSETHVSSLCRGCLFENSGCSNTVDPVKNKIKARINLSRINSSNKNESTNCGVKLNEFVGAREQISSVPLVTSLIK